MRLIIFDDACWATDSVCFPPVAASRALLCSKPMRLTVWISRFEVIYLLHPLFRHWVRGLHSAKSAPGMMKTLEFSEIA